MRNDKFVFECVDFHAARIQPSKWSIYMRSRIYTNGELRCEIHVTYIDLVIIKL